MRSSGECTPRNVGPKEIISSEGYFSKKIKLSTATQITTTCHYDFCHQSAARQNYMTAY